MNYNSDIYYDIFEELVGEEYSRCYNWADIASAIYNTLMRGTGKVAGVVDGESFVKDFLAGIEHEKLEAAGVTGAVPTWRMRIITGKTFDKDAALDPSFMLTTCESVFGSYQTFARVAEDWDDEDKNDVLALKVLDVLSVSPRSVLGVTDRVAMECLLRGKGFPKATQFQDVLYETLCTESSFALVQVFTEDSDKPIMAMCDDNVWKNPLAGLNEPLVELPGKAKWLTDMGHFAGRWNAESVSAFFRGGVALNAGKASVDTTTSGGKGSVRKMSL